MTTYRLGKHESVRLISADADRLVLEATYEPHGKPPPLHMHPFQIERFTVQQGRVAATVAGREITLDVGAELVIEPHTQHRMWNPDDTAARVRWVTEPPGRTQEWFATVDRLGGGRPTPALLVALLRHRDVFRPVITVPWPGRRRTV